MSRLTLLLCLFGLTCGQVLAELGTEAIVGGDHARKGDFKYQALLLLGTRPHCGGAIIDRQFILTAAHCVTRPPGHVIVGAFRIVVGIQNLRDKHGAIVVPVDTVYVPKDYKSTIGEHDIAVLKLKNGLTLNDPHRDIAKVNLPRAGANFDGVPARVSGFGIQSLKLRVNKGKLEKYDQKIDGKLKFALARIVGNAKCGELHRQNILPSTVCAQVFQHSKRNPEGTCNGDSGGPLVYENQIIGVLNAGLSKCDETNNPALYTRISAYVNMIHNIMIGKPGNDVSAIKV